LKQKVETFKVEYGVCDHKNVTVMAKPSLWFVFENWVVRNRQNITNCLY